MTVNKRSGGLPRASEAFTRAILDGADDIRRLQRRRRRGQRIALAVAAALLMAAGLGAALHRLSAPRRDDVALSPNPRGIVAEATATPEPAPPPSRVDEKSGWEYLLDAGPFAEGEWLVLTDEDGCLSYGVYVPFFERPSEDARSVRAVPGMQVKYLGQEEGGFALVEFAGQRGYVAADRLRRGAPKPALQPGVDYVLDEAALYVTDALGNTRAQFLYITDRELLPVYALKKVLDGLEPIEWSEVGDIPCNALLLARYRDPDDEIYPSGVMKTVDVRLNLALDGDFVFRDEEGRLYAGSETDETLFHTIFSRIGEEDSVYW